MKQYLLAITALSVAASAHATILEDWQFNGPGVTNGDDINTGNATTGASANSANTSGVTWTNNAWVSDVYDGKLLVGGRIGTDATWNNFEPDVPSGQLYFAIENLAWQLEGGTTGETISFGFGNGGDQTQVTGFQLQRTASQVVTLSGISDNGTAIGATATFGGSTQTIGSFEYDNISDSSYDFIVGVDYDADTYEVLYKTTVASSYTSLGSGTIAGGDVARSLAINVTGNASSINNGDVITNEEHFSIDRIYITNVNPVPEPSSYALISGFLALGWIMTRRRK